MPPSGGPLRPKAHVCHAGLALEVTARGLCVPCCPQRGNPEPDEAAGGGAARPPEGAGAVGCAERPLSLDTLPGSPPGPERDRSHQK